MRCEYCGDLFSSYTCPSCQEMPDECVECHFEVSHGVVLFGENTPVGGLACSDHIEEDEENLPFTPWAKIPPKYLKEFTKDISSALSPKAVRGLRKKIRQMMESWLEGQRTNNDWTNEERNFFDNNEAEHDADALIDYSSYENMVVSFICLIISLHQHQQILTDRFCFLTFQNATYAHLQKKYQLPIADIHKIITEGTLALRRKKNLNKLSDFWVSVNEIISSGGGVIHVNSLAKALQIKFDWPHSPNPHALGLLLLLRSSGNNIKKIPTIIKSNSVCRSCDKPLSFLKDLNDISTRSFNSGELAQKLFECCQTNCDFSPLPVKLFHDAFMECIISSTNSNNTSILD